jgi:hypothetical protein
MFCLPSNNGLNQSLGGGNCQMKTSMTGEDWREPLVNSDHKLFCLLDPKDKKKLSNHQSFWLIDPKKKTYLPKFDLTWVSCIFFRVARGVLIEGF